MPTTLWSYDQGELETVRTRNRGICLGLSAAWLSGSYDSTGLTGRPSPTMEGAGRTINARVSHANASSVFTGLHETTDHLKKYEKWRGVGYMETVAANVGTAELAKKFKAIRDLGVSVKLIGLSSAYDERMQVSGHAVGIRSASDGTRILYDPNRGGYSYSATEDAELATMFDTCMRAVVDRPVFYDLLVFR